MTRKCSVCGKELTHDLPVPACRVNSCRTQYYAIQDKIKEVQKAVKSGNYGELYTMSIKRLKRYGYKISLIEEIEPGKKITVASVREND